MNVHTVCRSEGGKKQAGEDQVRCRFNESVFDVLDDTMVLNKPSSGVHQIK